MMEYVHIENIRLVGTRDDFGLFASALAAHPCMTGFFMSCGCLEQQWNREIGVYDVVHIDEDAVSPVDPIVQALTTIESLNHLYLVSGYRSGVLTEVTFERISRVHHLKTLQILTITVSDSSLNTMAQFLKTKLLTNLMLSCRCLGKRGSEALACLLQKNPGIIHFLIYVDDIDTKAEVPYVLNKVSQAVGNAAKSLTNYTVKLCPKAYVPILLEHTRTMLRSNYRLKSIVIKIFTRDTGECTLVRDNEIAFLLESNKLGRGQLFQYLQNADKKILWMNLFEATRNDLSNIFYLVRSHPFEFAVMGLNDCSENMKPNMRSLKSSLRWERCQLKKAIEDEGIKTTVTLEEVFEGGNEWVLDEIHAKLDEALMDLQGKMVAEMRAIRRLLSWMTVVLGLVIVAMLASFENSLLRIKYNGKR